MSAAVAAPAPAVTPPSGLTLERYLESVLLEAREHGHADCPVCGSAMSAGAAELRCSGCGSRLI
jgi:tRNA(Ile2) C34 agmatinyltransferase TiaS